MKRLMSAMCVAVACSATAAMAQSTPPMDQGRTKDDKTMMKKGPVKVTGCVADKDAKGRYMLTNGTMADHMSTTTPSSQAPMAMSYALSGGDLKAHVGHKVEVTGTLEPTKSDKATMDKMDHKADAPTGTTATGTSGTTATGTTATTGTSTSTGTYGTTGTAAHGAPGTAAHGTPGMMDQDKMTGHDKMMSHTLKVKSVKMLAATCQ